LPFDSDLRELQSLLITFLLCSISLFAFNGHDLGKTTNREKNANQQNASGCKEADTCRVSIKSREQNCIDYAL